MHVKLSHLTIVLLSCGFFILFILFFKQGRKKREKGRNLFRSCTVASIGISLLSSTSKRVRNVMHLTVLGTATTDNKNGKRLSLYWTIKSHWMKRGCRLLLSCCFFFFYRSFYFLLFFFFFYYIEVVVGRRH